MTIAQVDLYRYDLPLKTPLHVGGETMTHRQGLLLRLLTEGGTVGWGDAAPLPGFSSETLDQTVASARALYPRLVGTEIPPDPSSISARMRELPFEAGCPSSLRFAVESAVVELVAAARGTSPAALLGQRRSTLSLNALLRDPLQEGEEQSRRCRAAGFEAVKMKVGRADVEAEAACIHNVRRMLGGGVALRLDANRAWSFEEALAFAEALGDTSVSYVEEPLADPSQLSTLTAQANLPIALDETTREVNPEALDGLGPIVAVVLKPTLLGGLTKTWRWAERAEAHRIVPVVSASYESGIGLRMLGALAASLPATPVGLSTYDRLAADVLQPPLDLTGPIVPVKALHPRTASVDQNRLEPVNGAS